MDVVEPILGIAANLYALCGQVKANKKRCQRLAQRVESLVELVKVVHVGKSPSTQAEVLRRGLRELRLTLESARDTVEKYTSSGFFKRVRKAYDQGDEFDMLNERLNDAAQHLSLALQADQRRNLERVFRRETRRKEDEEDAEIDNKELLKLLAVAEETKQNTEAMLTTVDATQREVMEIRDMLKSSRRPSIYQMDTREIKADELTYEVPKKPFMNSCNSEVYKGEYNKFTVAIKRYTCPMSMSVEQVRKIFKKEVETMRRFESPNILRMFGICVEEGPSPNYLIVMEYCEKGCLRQVLDSPSKLSWERKARMSLDAAQGIYRLHQSEENFKVHGCIASCKFLVDAGYRVKLGGFELAKTEASLKRSSNKKENVIYYCSPQQLQNVNQPYDKACEIYSFGIVLWEIATRQTPFKGCSSDKEIWQKVCVEKFMEPLPGDCPKPLAALIDDCRSNDPFYRPTAGVLVDMLRKVVQELEED